MWAGPMPAMPKRFRFAALPHRVNPWHGATRTAVTGCRLAFSSRMIPLLVFSIVLFVAAVMSGLARRSILSTEVLFVVAGLIAGHGITSSVRLQPDDPLVRSLADLALVAVLFTDGMRVGAHELRQTWRVPGRALLLGMPLTFLLLAALARALSNLPWLQCLLVAAVLTPTDPVFASAIVSRPEVSVPLRRLLNVESGLNDGLALPMVLGLLLLLGSGDQTWTTLAAEVAGGVAIGVAIPWIGARLQPLGPGAGIATKYQPLFVFSIGLLVFTLTSVTGANEYLGAFTAGISMATLRPELAGRFHDFGDLVAELLKLAALLAFGALVSLELLAQIGFSGWLFAAAALFIARPLPIAIVLARTSLPWRERAAAMWFGPKGFASVIYAIIVLRSGVPHADDMFYLIALVVLVSIILHSSSDVVIARWLAAHRR